MYMARVIRRQPHIYSAICKARLGYSSYVAAMAQRALYRREKHLFCMSPFEERHCEELKNKGLTVLHDLLSTALMDRIFEKVDGLFRDLQINFKNAYSVQKNRRSSLEGLSYQELESSEKVITLRDALLDV